MIKVMALWEAETKDGRTCLNGTLNENIQISILPNTFRKGPKSPASWLYIKENTWQKEEAPQTAQPDDIDWR